MWIHKGVVAVVAAFVVCLGGPAFATVPIVSTFDTDAEGWTETGAALTYEPTGGNAGGFLRLEDNAGDSYIAFPPPKFKGDLSAYNGGLLTYDITVFVPDRILSSVGSGFGRIQLNGNGTNATFDYAPDPPVPSVGAWKTYYVPFTAQAWNTTEANWTTLLSNVEVAHITLDLIGGDDTIGLDNFRLASAVPEPGTVVMMGIGMTGLWRKRKANIA